MSGCGLRISQTHHAIADVRNRAARRRESAMSETGGRSGNRGLKGMNGGGERQWAGGRNERKSHVPEVRERCSPLCASNESMV